MHIEIDTDDFHKQMSKYFGRKSIDKFINKNITDYLFAVRDFAVNNPKGMSKEFTIRAKGLVRKHIRIKKAFGLVGYFGSLDSPSFSGWVEQQLGTPTKRKIKVHTINARAGGRKKLSPRFRRSNKSARNLLRPIRRSSGNVQTIAANLAILRRERYGGAVVLPKKYGDMKPGIYQRYKTGKLKLMEIWEQKQPKKNPWATDIVMRWFATGADKKILAENLDKALNKK